MDERERVDRIMEFVIAFGCGQWRNVQLGGGGWEHRWHGALRVWCALSNRQLRRRTAGWPSTWSSFPKTEVSPMIKISPEDTAVWSDAWSLATRLVRPEHSFYLEEQESITFACLPEGTDCTSSTQDYRHTIFPGAKAIWTVPEGKEEACAAKWTIPHARCWNYSPPHRSR